MLALSLGRAMLVPEPVRSMASGGKAEAWLQHSKIGRLAHRSAVATASALLGAVAEAMASGRAIEANHFR